MALARWPLTLVIRAGPASPCPFPLKVTTPAAGAWEGDEGEMRFRRELFVIGFFPSMVCSEKFRPTLDRLSCSTCLGVLHVTKIESRKAFLIN